TASLHRLDRGLAVGCLENGVLVIQDEVQAVPHTRVILDDQKLGPSRGFLDQILKAGMLVALHSLRPASARILNDRWSHRHGALVPPPYCRVVPRISRRI